MAGAFELVQEFIETRRRLVDEATKVSSGLRGVPFVGHWCLGDVLAHLIGWDYANVEAIAALREGRLPGFYAYYDLGWAAYNEHLVERHRDDDWDELVAAERVSRDAIVSALRGLSPTELTTPHAFPERRKPIRIAGILRAAIRDEQEHIDQIRVFREAHAQATGSE